MDAHRPAEHRPAGGQLSREIGVERHGDVAQEIAAERGHLVAIAVPRDQAILRERLEPGVTLLQLRRHESVGQLQVAHQVEDGAATAPVVGAQAMTSLDRKLAGVEDPLVFPGARHVLDVAVRHLPDGAHAEGQQVRSRSRRVPHEVAMKPPLASGEHQVVRRAGEVVHAEPLIAAAGEGVHRHPEELELLPRRRERAHVDQPLVGPHLGHVSIAVAGHPVRGERHHRLERSRETRGGLLRKPVHQIDVHPAEPGLPGELHRLAHDGPRLDPPDRRLHHRVEILNPVADALKAEPAQRGELLHADVARVGLHRSLGAGREREVPLEHLAEPLELSHGQEVGCAAPQVELDGPAPEAQGSGDQLELALHPVEIAIDHGGPRGDGHGAGAVVAAVSAEGEVHVQRHRILIQPGERA
jgi:hypothetical protein